MTAPTMQPSVEDGLDLVRRHQAGDREAFAEIYRIHYPLVFRFASRRVLDRQLAEDLAQDTFCKAFAQLGTQFECRDKAIGAWLFTIARNLVADHFKRLSTRLSRPSGAVTSPFENGAFDLLDPVPAADEPVLAALRSQDLAAALLYLTDQQQTVLILRYFRGLSVVETAREMGIAEGAVKAATYRATRNLAQRLDVEDWL
ncbi:RNA polymerase sigma factor [Actinoplanes lobatus]|uniref:RNA polymerase sigma factor n=1 Tax=Actinoplanes lobatus TaxID=113568 RepID=A0A7W7MG87_9ACTN|nr:sigma-70 family RNA polymerase sigma factor [Actinoplanes lobatus]MBB4749177.1 RNA polymerase sigma-70 factor (ECF subfamily) [Actinoplanes lobatus]GGN80462.1 RNA polymerase sigma factor [Actinoplanes lobatus]GIE45265.1 RNA polymerase sigma factor [Actinoplanes lobatus]